MTISANATIIWNEKMHTKLLRSKRKLALRPRKCCFAENIYVIANEGHKLKFEHEVWYFYVQDFGLHTRHFHPVHLKMLLDTHVIHLHVRNLLLLLWYFCENLWSWKVAWFLKENWPIQVRSITSKHFFPFNLFQFEHPMNLKTSIWKWKTFFQWPSAQE